MNEYCFYDYVIEFDKKIGQGQFGIVVECYHKFKYKNISLCAKIVQNNTNIDESMMKEIQILKKIKSINNPHLIIVYDVFEAENKFFIIMERCKGGELKHLIDKKKQLQQKFKTSEIIDFIYQFIDGYSILYNNKIMHRDIKPQNIFVDLNQQFKIGDLGAGRILEDVKIKGDYTKIGSPLYSSPQILTLQKFSPLTDVYSFGMVLFQLTFLDFPFKPLLSDLQNFILSIQKQRFMLDRIITNEGTQREKDEIQFLIENMLVYDESQRISWEKLFERIEKEVVYEQFREKYQEAQLMNTTINWEEKNKKKQAKEAKQLQEATKIYQQPNNKMSLNTGIPFANQEKKRSSISQYLKIQYFKIIVIDSALSYLQEVAYQNIIYIQLIEYLELLSSMYGYYFNLLKNIEAIHKGDYNSLSEHIREQKDKEYQNYQAINEFEQFKTEDDKKIIEQSSQLLQNLIGVSIRTIDQTISKINSLKIRFQVQCDLREVLQKFQVYNNYYHYWEFIRKFFNLCLQKKFSEYLYQEFSQLPEQLLLFMVYMYELIGLEEKHKQLELFKENKIMIIPKQNYNRQDAIQYLENKRKELQNQQINQNQFF